MNKIDIPLNRARICLAIFGSLCFVAVGLCFIFYANTLAPNSLLLPKTVLIVLIFSAGILGVITFGMFTIIGFKILFKKQPNLIIDKQGITLQNFGLIEWCEITNIKTKIISKNKIILIEATQPKKYLARLDLLSQFLAKSNLLFYKTPITISPKSFKCNEDELILLLQNKLALYGNRCE